MTDIKAELARRIKCQPSVSRALDDYARAIKTWGVTDNTPRRLVAAEDAMLRAVIVAALDLTPNARSIEDLDELPEMRMVKASD